ncbi:hypothetical protein ABTY59_37400 [Streptomyces sp. NPDC096079]|uniref:hypothetical protein n=1 Tax=Streptomyces sp. NPDC096079 TaxID=3155820 RepID=UPI00332B74C2
MARKRNVIMAAACLLVVAGTCRAVSRQAAGDVPAEAAGWYGAMSLYRTVAVWAGKRAMLAEVHYWEAVTP